MTLNSIRYIYSKENSEFEYNLFRKHSGISKDDKFILISQDNFNEILKLEEYLFRDTYRDIAKAWARKNCDFNSNYELSFLVNELLDDKKKLKKIVSENINYNLSKKSNICELLGNDDFDKPKFYNNGNFNQRNYKYNQRMTQLYNSHKKRK